MSQILVFEIFLHISLFCTNCYFSLYSEISRIIILVILVFLKIFFDEHKTKKFIKFSTGTDHHA